MAAKLQEKAKEETKEESKEKESVGGGDRLSYDIDYLATMSGFHEQLPCHLTGKGKKIYKAPSDE